jgi:hypothetical protein
MEEIIRGDTARLNFTILDNEGDPFELENSEVFFTLKENKRDEDDDAIIEVDFEYSGTGNEVEVELTPEETDITPRVYYYDLQIKTEEGDIFSIPSGMLRVRADITRRT